MGRPAILSVRAARSKLSHTACCLKVASGGDSDRIIHRRIIHNEVSRGMHMSTATVSIVLTFFFSALLTYGQTSGATSGAAPAEYQPKGSIREYF